MLSNARFALILALLVLIPAAGHAQSYADSIRAERAEKDLHFETSAVSPFTAIGQAVLRPGKAVRVVLAADTLLLSRPSADVGLPQLEIIWDGRRGGIYARKPMGGHFFLNERPLGPVPRDVRPGDTLRAEHYRLQVYRGANLARVMAFDPYHPRRVRFTGLNWFEPKPEWRVRARIERVADPDTVEMTTSLGLTKRYLPSVRLHAITPGGQGTLTMYVPAHDPDAWGFVPFTDETSGELTYGGGRYLDVPLPQPGQTHMIIDLNKAYNPYCAYTDHYNCPVPPRTNHFPFPVRAGEKRYK